MKVSDITNELVANYSRLDFSSMTDAEKAELTTLISIAKTFIRGYTGIKEQTISGEEIGVGDGKTMKFATEYPVIPETSTIYADGVELTETTQYTLDDATGSLVILTAPDTEVKITGDYATGLDAYEDFVIVVYILCQDMYDNRTFYVGKSNLNRVVDTILTMHSINLL